MSKGRINLVHLYPREMSIYGDLGNTRCLASRLRSARHCDKRLLCHKLGSYDPPRPFVCRTGN